MLNEQNARHLIEKLVFTLDELGASDIHIVPDQPPALRVRGKLKKLTEFKISAPDTVAIQMYMLSQLSKDHQQVISDDLKAYRNAGFSFVVNGRRFRVNISYKGNGRYIVLREIRENPPDLETLGFNDRVMEGLYSIINAASDEKISGLFPVVGATGSGKSTTLASIIKEINKRGEVNIITLEDPIEYVHKPIKAQIVQKEYGTDFKRFKDGLHSALREDPNIILVGEIRDGETLELTLRAAETGHLVFTTLHTKDAVSTINRLCFMAESDKRDDIRYRLSQVLVGILAQKLVLGNDGKRKLVYEALFPDVAVLNLIAENKDMQIQALIDTTKHSQSFETTLLEYVKAGILTPEKAYNLSFRKKEMETKLRAEGINFDAQQAVKKTEASVFVPSSSFPTASSPLIEEEEEV